MINESDSSLLADEVYCSSCGKKIKREAEICPLCGVKNLAYCQCCFPDKKKDFDCKEYLLELLKIQTGQINKRRDIEWKVCITFWSALIVGTGFLLNNTNCQNDIFIYINMNKVWVYVLFSLLWLLFSLWIGKLQSSDKRDHHYIKEYRTALEDNIDFHPVGYRHCIFDCNMWWTLPEILITLIILTICALLLTNT